VELKNNKNNFYLTEEKYISLREVKVTKSVNVKKTVYYRRLERFDIVNITGEKKLIFLMNDDFEVMHYYVRYNELYYAHIATSHAGRNRTMYEVNSIYKHFNIESIYKDRIITELEKYIISDFYNH
jgi:hypothetical protein